MLFTHCHCFIIFFSVQLILLSFFFFFDDGVFNPLRKYCAVDSTTLEINTLHMDLSKLHVSGVFYLKYSLNITKQFYLRFHILWVYLRRIQLYSSDKSLWQLIFKTSTKSRQYTFLLFLTGLHIWCLKYSCFPSFLLLTSNGEASQNFVWSIDNASIFVSN